MRALGAGERALAMMVARVQDRVAFGKPLAEQGAVRERIAESRIDARPGPRRCATGRRTSSTAQGNKAARHLVAEAKVAVPRTVTERHRPGHPGPRRRSASPTTSRSPTMWGWHRAMRIFDGPDEVHLTSIARAELGRAPRFTL